MRDQTRGREWGILRWLGALVAIAVPLALNVSPAAAATDGVGSASARGTDPDALATVGLGTLPVEAQYSAITNCDEAANTRPFIVQVPAFGVTIRRTSTATSTCQSQSPTSINEGTGEATSTGGPGTISWRFTDSPDFVVIVVHSNSGATLEISGPPQPLNGRPGGVWVFGQLPWPAEP